MKQNRNSKVLAQLAKATAAIILNRIPTPILRWGILGLAVQRAYHLPPADGLRFLLELDNRLYEHEGRLSIAYDGGIHTKHRHTRYHEFFVARIDEHETVLDVGCGVGALAYSIATQSGAHVYGIDINAASIVSAQANYSHPHITYAVGDVLQSLPETQFDVVVLSNILEHLPERPAFLRRVVEVARPKRLLIRVPLFERDWRVPLKKELGIEWRLDPTHELEYTPEGFKEEMQFAGLTITHWEIRWGEIWAEVRPV